MKKKKKLNSQQVKLIINLISLAVFAFSYFYVYAGLVKETEAADKEAELSKQFMQEQTQKLAEEETVRQDTAGINDQLQSILDSYPVYIAKEDNYIFIDQMQKALGIKFTSVDINDAVEFQDTGLPVRTDAEGTDTAAGTDKTGMDATGTGTADTQNSGANNMKIMQTTITMGFSTSYEGFKDLADYIKNYPDKTIIDSAAVSYDNTTGGLTGSLVLRRFAMTGTGKEYVAPVIDDISIGTDNIFGTSPDISSDEPANQNGTDGQTDQSGQPEELPAQ